MNNKFLRKYGVLLFLILVMPVFWFFFGHAKLFDDNYIYLQYAKHFWELNELSFNAGEISYAFTSPLWQIFYILLYPVLSFDTIPVFLSTIFSVSTIIFCWYVLRDIFKQISSFLFAMLIISLDPIFMKHAFNGMETSCAGFLAYVVILGIVFSEKIRNNYFIGIIFGVFLLIRPESAVLALLTILYLFLNDDKTLKDIGIMLLTNIVVILPWIIFAQIYFGKIIPDTYGAKGGDYPFGNLFSRNFFDAVKVLGGNYLPLFLLALFQIRKVIAFIKTNLLLNRYFLSVVVFYVFAYSVIISHETFYARYMVLFTPALLLFLISFFIFTLGTKRKFLISMSAIMMLTLIIAFIFSRFDKEIVESGHVTEAEVTSWIMSHTKKDSYIYRDRIGYIGFKTQRRIFDPIGLINRDIAVYYQSNKIIDYYKMMNPDYFVYSSEVLISNLKQEASFELKKEFLVKRRWLLRDMLTFNNSELPGIDTLRIYKATWRK